MATFRVIGKVNADGKLEFELPNALEPGTEVEITIATYDADAEAKAEAQWDELLARPESLALLNRMADQARKNRAAGLTEELDPDTL